MLTTFMDEKEFYRTGSQTLAQLKGLVSPDPFVAKAAILARTWGMRSVTHVTMAELARVTKGSDWLRPAIAKAVQRPDDASEILAYWMKEYGKPIPNVLKRGLADALAKFDAYALAKYRGETHELKMVDVVNLVHASSPTIGQLIRGTLETPYTWETEITAAGKDEEAKRAAWTRLVESGKLGYFALLRNLRNLETFVSDETMTKAYAQLTNAEAIRKSKVLPFRFDTAMEQVSKPATRAAIAQAADLACSNLPYLKGKTLVALDCSGSMSGRPLQIGSIFAAALAKATHADILQFGTSVAKPRYNPGDTMLTIAKSMQANFGGTDFNLIFDSTNVVYDRIIILSDMQAWVQRGGYYGSSNPKAAFEEYKKRTGANPAIWSFDLKGYGTLQFPETKVYCLAGWSEKVLDLIPLIEDGGRDALIREIEKVSLF